MTRNRPDFRWGILYFLTLGYIILFFVLCRHSAADGLDADTDAEIRVYFFHLAARCDVCTAIEENTKRVLEEHFKNQIDSGTIKFKSINIDSRENKLIAEKYQISYTSLLLVRDDGTFTDFTNTSLNYAFMNPSKFRELLKSEMDKNLE